MTKAWYKTVKNYETNYKEIGQMTDEELDRCEFNVEMVDRWQRVHYETIDAIRAERREREQNKKG